MKTTKIRAGLYEFTLHHEPENTDITWTIEDRYHEYGGWTVTAEAEGFAHVFGLGDFDIISTKREAVAAAERAHYTMGRMAGLGWVTDPQFKWTPTEDRAAKRLYTTWEKALTEHRRDDTDQTMRREQAAYDELLDYVDAHDLTYGRYDPR